MGEEKTRYKIRRYYSSYVFYLYPMMASTRLCVFFSLLFAPSSTAILQRAPPAARAMQQRRRIAMVSPLSILKPVAASYCQSLATAPLLTNCLTASALSVTSDAIAQRVERQKSTPPPAARKWSPGAFVARHDFSRSVWMSAWGFTISGLLVHYWFIFLNGLFPVAGLTLAGALKKVTVNQIVMSPLLNAMFFAFTTYTRGDVAGGSRRAFLRRKLDQDLVPTMKRSCVYWGSVQLVNFLYVPQRFTLLYTNIGFLIWTVYVSLVGYRQVKS